MKTEKNQEEQKIKTNFKKITSIIKLLLFVSAIILTYFISNAFIDYTKTIEIETLKRVLNLILVILVAIFYMKGEKKNDNSKSR